MNGYMRAMAPQIEMRKAFGSTTLDDQIAKITEEYHVQLNRLSSNAEKNKLEKETSAALRDLGALRDRLLGHTGPKGASQLAFVRALRLARAYNYVRLLGGQTLSSLNEYGRVMMRYGMPRTAAMTVKLLTNMRANKLTRTDAHRVGTALEWVLDSKNDTLADIGDEAAGTKAEAVMGALSNKFTRYTGQATWTSAIKSLTAALEQDLILRALRRPNGPTKNDMQKLAEAGIGEKSYAAIREQITKHADDSEGLLRARTEAWDDPAAARMVEDAVVRAADIMGSHRGLGDLPLMMDGEIIKTLMQFKSFGMSATNRILIPVAQGLARGDAATANGLMAMLGLGAMTYMMKELAAGREPDLSAARVIPEALNWSGLMAYLPDYYDPFVAGPLHAPRLSRYSNRTPIETLLGPTVGTAGQLVQTIPDITDSVPWADDGDGIAQDDLRKLRQLAPLQNLFYLRRIINALEGEAGQAIGAEGATNKSVMDRVTETLPPEPSAGN
jgi:hypothetical protein